MRRTEVALVPILLLTVLSSCRKERSGVLSKTQTTNTNVAQHEAHCFGVILQAPSQMREFRAALTIKNRCSRDLFLLVDPVVARGEADRPFRWETAYRENAFGRLYVYNATTGVRFVGERAVGVRGAPVYARIRHGQDVKFTVNFPTHLAPGSYGALFQSWIGVGIQGDQKVARIDAIESLKSHNAAHASEPLAKVPNEMATMTSNEVRFNVVP